MPSRALMAMAVLLLAPPAVAQSPAPADRLAQALETRAAALPTLMGNDGQIEAAFTPEFFAAVPIAQLRQVFASLRAQHGAPQRLVRLLRGPGAGGGTAIIAYERADITVMLAVDASGRIAGLRITDVAVANDSIDRLAAELAALPGDVGWGLYRLSADGDPQRIAGNDTRRSLAIGSTFKLVILAALDAEVAAGRMRWDDVIRIDRASVPSGMTQDWPVGTPITLQSAAQLMIAISDNTTTDLLIRHLGRERIEAFARAHGGLDGPMAFPLLTTIEATVLKNPALGAARRDWLAADSERARRAVLSRHAASFVPANVNYGAFTRPADIDTIEWFASADGMARLMHWYANQASETARAIIAVNPGIPTGNARQWAYVGYKGGSEPGVMAMTLLLRDDAGESYAVAMAWNNTQASVEESRLTALATRAAALLRRQSAR